MNGIKAAYEMISIPLSAANRELSALAGPGRKVRREFEYGDDKDQRIMVYKPDKITRDKVVVFFSGGLSGSGRPEILKQAADVFVSEGYVFFACGIGSLATHSLEEAAENAAGSFHVVLRILEDLRLEGRRIVLGGISTGALFATLIAFGDDFGEKYEIKRDNVEGVISISGILNVSDLSKARIIRKKEGKNVGRSVETSLQETMMPLHEISFLAIHGREDQVAPYRTARSFVNRMNELSPRTAEGREPATLYTLSPWKYQHVRLADGLFGENRKKSRTLRFLFRWIEQLGVEPEKKEMKTPIQDAVKAEKRAKKVVEQAAAGHDNI